MSTIPPTQEGRRRPVSVLALKLWEVAEALEQRLDNPAEVLEMLVTAVAKGEQPVDAWQRLHAAAARHDKVADLAFAYEQTVSEKRVKLLQPEQQAFVYLRAAEFFSEALGDTEGAIAHATRAAAAVPGHPEAFPVLEALLRGPDDVLLLDEPDNYLDVPGKRWLEQRLIESPKSVLLISHDRELLDRVANRIVTIEGGTAWTHGGGFASYHEARRHRHDRLDEVRRRWDEEHKRLIELVRTLQQQAKISPDMASKYHAMQTRLAKFEEAGPPPSAPPVQKVAMRLRGGRTGLRAVTCQELELTGLVQPFNLEIFYGERVAVLGANGSGKSHFLRLLAGDQVRHTGIAKLGARVVPGWFAQTHDHAELSGRTLAEVLWADHARNLGQAMNVLRRYELDGQAEQPFGTLSGGQQARFQILLLEISGATLLLLDEPTDNLDVASAEALEDALEAFDGTVIAVTHDRWFARSFERFLIFGSEGAVAESAEPIWDTVRVAR